MNRIFTKFFVEYPGKVTGVSKSNFVGNFRNGQLPFFHFGIFISDFNLTVEQLAKELHLSHSQFGRKLDALTGYSPSQFIRILRLRNAKKHCCKIKI